MTLCSINILFIHSIVDLLKSEPVFPNLKVGTKVVQINFNSFKNKQVKNSNENNALTENVNMLNKDCNL